MRTLFLTMLWCVLCGYAVGAAAQTCSASSSPVTFGTYDPLSALVNDSAGAISVSCTASVGAVVSYTIKLNGGSSGTISARKMSAGASNLFYQLYTNISRSTVWGDGTAGSSSVADSLLGIGVSAVVKPYTVFGRIGASQNVSSGVYADSVTVLVEY